MCRAALAACAAGLLLAPNALTAPGADPNAARVAKALKESMQRTYKTTVPGLRFRRVTCTLAASLRSGDCKATFTYAAKHLNGVYRVKATIDPGTGGVRWRATSVSCTNARTDKKVAC
jgi:hypothetical protein